MVAHPVLCGAGWELYTATHRHAALLVSTSCSGAQAPISLNAMYDAAARERDAQKVHSFYSRRPVLACRR